MDLLLTDSFLHEAAGLDNRRPFCNCTGALRVHHDESIERFYTTTAWRKARAAVLRDSNGLCQICLSKGLIVPAVHVHHKIHLSPDNIDNPMITLDSSNLMALCEACHAEQHRTKRWRVDPMGRVVL